MEMMNSAIVMLVLKMKEIVILMMSVKMVLYVDQTTAQIRLVLTSKQIAVMFLFLEILEMKIFVQR